MGSILSGADTDWTVEKSFNLACISDLISAAAIMSSAFTTYCRISNGSYYIRLQVRLIGAAGFGLFIRDIVIALFHNSEPSLLYTWIAGILEVLYICVDITAYWLFAYKYWTASFVTNDQIVRTNAKALREGSNSAV